MDLRNIDGEVDRRDGEPLWEPVVTGIASPSWPSTLMVTLWSLMKLSVHLAMHPSRPPFLIFRSRQTSPR